MSLHVVVAGSSGFLGTHLVRTLRERGHSVTTLVRRPAGPKESTWDPYADDPEKRLDPALIAAADVVVNLAGSPTLGNPHSRKWSDELLRSRVTTTRVLAEAIAAAGSPPAFLAGSGIAYYGDHADQVLTETADTRGHALLTEVCRQWEGATAPAANAGARVVLLRTAPVMDRTSAPLKPLSLLFRTGLGGRLGSGRQHMPMISLRDWLGGVAHLAEHPSASGPANLCCVTTPTNAEFTRTLAKALHRPAFAAVPAPIIRTATGRMAPELLGSVNVRPQTLLDAGYVFSDPGVSEVIATGLAGHAG
ncbi:TIGR01777 family oxidoreductase [Nocardioides sp. TRM66260-LWL]|uniref:TIGR01777 family oxidoreductase n=1 Tax=Nocardioides sp. TRM66260-LWL TaxID=2874478 RepID=UPI001CC395B2|nr:TIGR01777 family oxidoreductase [Nocardioides sp. TRM66260-LWL]MBZ5733644.1 TIGR01777 family oxidoreductase [Nocardioides sp. TRM66260-LWL]